jgi:large subunit ribosomal protein L23
MKTRLLDVLLTPHGTEKATYLAEMNKYVFKVANDATSPEVKQAVEQIFSTKVTKVNMINVEGKKKVFKGRKGKRSDFKKAIVTLEKGKTIDISSGVK